MRNVQTMVNDKEKGWWNEVNHLKIKWIDKYVPNNKNLNILDLAAGKGWYSKYLAKKGHFLTSVDQEIQFESKDNILQKKVNLEKKLPFDNESFDFVIAWDIIEHIKNEEKLIKEIGRVLKPKGNVLVSVPHADDSKLTKVHLTYSHFKDKTHQREYTPIMLRKHFETCGFNPIKIKLQGGDAYPYLLKEFVPYKFWKIIVHAFIKFLRVFSIVRVDNCHGDVFAIFKKEVE